MKVALGLIGYNCKPEITRALDGWAGHVDCMILGDGKFDFYPDNTDYSTDGWLEFCEKRYDNVITYKYAGDQYTKRQKYLDIAGEENCDFLIVVDTDEYLDPYWQNWDRFYKQLAVLSQYTKDRLFFMWEYIPDEKLWSKQGNVFTSNMWRRSTRIHKNPGTMRYCMQSHYTWCPKSITDESLIKWQLKHRDETNPYQFISNNVIDGVRIRMDRTLRTPEQIQKGAEWAFINQHAENSKRYYKVAKAHGTPPPYGCKTWEEFENAKHTFDPDTGRRIELELK